MTTILGRQFEDGFVMAADTQVTSGDRPYRHASMAKISRVGYLWVAGAGHAPSCDVIQHNWTPPKRSGSTPYEEMIKSIVPSMRWALEKSGVKAGDEDAVFFLVGLDDRLFIVDSDTVLVSDTGIYGIGSGSHYGIGALHAGASMEEAIRIASMYDIYTGGSVQIVEGGKDG